MRFKTGDVCEFYSSDDKLGWSVGDQVIIIDDLTETVCSRDRYIVQDVYRVNKNYYQYTYNLVVMPENWCIVEHKNSHISIYDKLKNMLDE